MKIYLVFFCVCFSALLSHAQVIGGFDANEATPTEVKPSALTAGEVADNVNHFTGDLNLSYNLGSVSTPGGMDFNLSLSYSPSIVVGANSSIVKGVPYGEGWNLNIPSLTVHSDIYNSLIGKFVRNKASLQNLIPLGEDIDTNTVSYAPRNLVSNLDGKAFWYNPTINIPGVASGRMILKYFDGSKAIFVLNAFEKYVEAHLIGKEWKVYLDDGTVYTFDLPQYDYRNPTNNRLSTNGLLEDQVLDATLDHHQNYETNSLNYLPKQTYGTWFCTEINNLNQKGEGIRFQYERYGEFNYFKEFNQDNFEFSYPLARFFGRSDMMGNFNGANNALIEFKAYQEIFLSAVTSYGVGSIYEELDLEYETEIFVNSQIMYADEDSGQGNGVQKKDNLYNFKTIFQEGGDQNFTDWQRFKHQKLTDAEDLYPGTIGSSNPYLDVSSSPGQYRQSSIGVGSSIPFNHSVLESPRIGINGFDLVPGDTYEVKTKIRNTGADVYGGNIDINVVARKEPYFSIFGGGFYLPLADADALEGTGVNLQNVGTSDAPLGDTEQLQAFQLNGSLTESASELDLTNESAFVHSINRGQTFFSTFGNAIKWNTNANDGLSDNTVETSNYFVLPSTATVNSGFNIQIGPGNVDMDHSWGQSNPPVALMGVTGITDPYASAYNAYAHRQQMLSNHDQYGSPHTGMLSRDNVPHSFGNGMPWSNVHNVYFPVMSGMGILTGENANPFNNTTALNADMYKFWWNGNAYGDGGFNSSVLPQFENRPTRIGPEVQLEQVEVVRYSKNTYMLKAAKKYRYDGKVSSSLLPDDDIDKNLINHVQLEYGLERSDFIIYNNQIMSESYDDQLLENNYPNSAVLTRHIHPSETVEQDELGNLVLAGNKPFYAKNLASPTLWEHHIQLKALVEVPIQNYTATENVDIATTPLISFEYSTLQDASQGLSPNDWKSSQTILDADNNPLQVDFIPLSKMLGLVESDNMYVISAYTDQLGGEKSFEYYPISYPLNDLKVKKRGGKQLRQLYAAQGYTNALSSNNAPREYSPLLRKTIVKSYDVETNSVENLETDYTYIPEYFESPWSTDIEELSIRKSEEVSFPNHFVGNTINNTSIGFQNVVVHQTPLDLAAPEDRIYSKYIFADNSEGTLEKRMLHGKLRKTEHYNHAAQKLAEDINEYEVQLAFESGYFRPLISRDNWFSTYDYMDYYVNDGKDIDKREYRTIEDVDNAEFWLDAFWTPHFFFSAFDAIQTEEQFKTIYRQVLSLPVDDPIYTPGNPFIYANDWDGDFDIDYDDYIVFLNRDFDNDGVGPTENDLLEFIITYRNYNSTNDVDGVPTIGQADKNYFIQHNPGFNNIDAAGHKFSTYTGNVTHLLGYYAAHNSQEFTNKIASNPTLYNSYFVSVASTIHREFDLTGLALSLGAADPDIEKEIADNPVGWDNVITVVDNFRQDKINTIHNYPNEATTKRMLLDNSPLHREVLAALIQSPSRFTAEVLRVQPHLDNSLTDLLIVRTNISALQKTSVLMKANRLSEGQLKSIIRENAKLGPEQSSRILTHQKSLSAPMLKYLSGFVRSFEPAHINAIYNKQHLLTSTEILDLVNKKVSSNTLNGLILHHKIGTAAFINSLQKSRHPEKELLIQQVALHVLYPTELQLTSMVKDLTFDKEILGEIISNHKVKFSDAFKRGILAAGIFDRERYDRWDINHSGITLPNCTDPREVTLSLEVITEFDYYDANERGISDSEGYQRLFGLDHHQMHLKYEPSWQLAKKKVYSPQTKDEFTEEWFYYLYDLANRYDRLSVENMYPNEDTYELIDFGTIGGTDRNLWMWADGDFFPHENNPDGLLKSQEYNMRNLVFQTEFFSKLNPIAEVESSAKYYFYDARWNAVEVGTSTTEEGYFSECPEIYDGGGDGTGGGDGNGGGDGDGTGTGNGNSNDTGNSWTGYGSAADFYADPIFNYGKDSEIVWKVNAQADYKVPATRNIYKAIYQDIAIKNALLLRSISNKVDTIPFEDYQALNNLPESNYLLEFTRVQNEEQIPWAYELYEEEESTDEEGNLYYDHWMPVYPFDVVTTLEIHRRNRFAQPNLVRNERGIFTKLEFTIPEEIHHVNLTENCGNFQYYYSEHTALPTSITVGYGREDALTKTFDYYPSGHLKSISDENNGEIRYVYNDFYRLKEAYFNDFLTGKNEYHSFYRDYETDNSDFVTRANQNYVRSTVLTDYEGNKGVESLVFLNPLRQTHASMSYPRNNVGQADEMITSFIDAGNTIEDRWQRTIKKYKQKEVSFNGLISTLLKQDNLSTEIFHASRYENDQKGRLLKSAKPGLDLEGNHTIDIKYDFATAEYFACEAELNINEILQLMGQSYADNVLLRKVITDEDNHKKIEYTNTLGQILASIGFVEDAQKAVTLYVYDTRGNLTTTINPEKQKSYYRYNLAGNLYEKQTLDDGISRYLFDKSGLTVLEQNETMQAGVYDIEIEKEVPYYREYCYDAYGRLTRQKLMYPYLVLNGNYYEGFPLMNYESFSYWYDENGYNTNDFDLVLEDYDPENADFYHSSFSHGNTLSWLPNAYTLSNSSGELNYILPVEHNLLETNEYGTAQTNSYKLVPEKRLYYDSQFSDLLFNGVNEEAQLAMIEQHYMKGKLSHVLSYSHLLDKNDHLQFYDALEEPFHYFPSHMAFYSYDSFGRLTQFLQQSNENGIRPDDKGIVYRIDQPEYSLTGNLLTQNIDLHADSILDFQYHYSFDEYDRLHQIKVSLEDNQDNGLLITEYSYDNSNGKISSRKHLSPCEVDDLQYQYDGRDRLTGISSRFLDYQLYYDQNAPQHDGTSLNLAHHYNGNINGMSSSYNVDDLDFYIQDLFSDATQYAYAYDGLNRLTQADAIVGNHVLGISDWSDPHYTIGDVAFDFDKIGNFNWLDRGIINTEDQIESESWEYDYWGTSNRLNEVTALNEETSTRTYTYDLLGNLQTDSHKEINATVYDRANLPGKLAKSIDTIYYKYNHNDQRIFKRVKENGENRIDEFYLRDNLGRELAILDRTEIREDGLPWTFYVFGNERVAKITPNAANQPIIDSPDTRANGGSGGRGFKLTYPFKLYTGTLGSGEMVGYTETYYLNYVLPNTGLRFRKRKVYTIKRLQDLNTIKLQNGPDMTRSINAIISGGGGGKGDGSETFPVFINFATCGCPNLEPIAHLDDQGKELIVFDREKDKYGRDQIIDEVTFYVEDHLGNTRVVYTTEALSTAAQCNGGNGGGIDPDLEITLNSMLDYYPYGKVLREYRGGEAERYLTTQHERDEETGLDYRGARFYDADVARFLSLDPLSADYASWSDYNYVLGNPVKYIDPDGKSAGQADQGGEGDDINEDRPHDLTIVNFGSNNADELVEVIVDLTRETTDAIVAESLIDVDYTISNSNLQEEVELWMGDGGAENTGETGNLQKGLDLDADINVIVEGPLGPEYGYGEDIEISTSIENIELIAVQSQNGSTSTNKKESLSSSLSTGEGSVSATYQIGSQNSDGTYTYKAKVTLTVKVENTSTGVTKTKDVSYVIRVKTKNEYGIISK